MTHDATSMPCGDAARGREEATFTYRCERNMIAGKKLGQRWHYVDSTGASATATVQPRSS